MNSKDDLKRYREGYPDDDLNDQYLTKNVEFYSNELPSSPDGSFVDTIHRKWWGDDDKLEVHHSYIQWLFPIHESGLNYRAQILQRHEAATIASTPAMQARLIKSYEMMLDFYGMVLVDVATGEVRRSEEHRDGGLGKARYSNLNHSSHNYLRITRILKCLGECGLEYLKKPWLELFVTEVYSTGALANCASSLRRFWAPSLRDAAERDSIRATIEAAENPALEVDPTPGDGLTFSPRDIGKFVAVWCKPPRAAASAWTTVSGSGSGGGVGGGSAAADGGAAEAWAYREAKITDYWGIASRGHLCEFRGDRDASTGKWINFRRQGADDRPPQMLRPVRAGLVSGGGDGAVGAVGAAPPMVVPTAIATLVSSEDVELLTHQELVARRLALAEGAGPASTEEHDELGLHRTPMPRIEPGSGDFGMPRFDRNP